MSKQNLVVSIVLALVAIALGVGVSVFLAATPVAAPAGDVVAPIVADVAEETIPITEVPSTGVPLPPEPLLMSLSMKTWEWQETSLNDGTTVVPDKAAVFSVTFNADGTFGATTDCNSVGGNYTTDGSLLTFTEMMSTEMYCEGSKEADFVGYLSTTSGYHFTTRGELILDLKFDSGSVVLR